MSSPSGLRRLDLKVSESTKKEVPGLKHLQHKHMSMVEVSEILFFSWKKKKAMGVRKEKTSSEWQGGKGRWLWKSGVSRVTSPGRLRSRSHGDGEEREKRERLVSECSSLPLTEPSGVRSVQRSPVYRLS